MSFSTRLKLIPLLLGSMFLFSCGSTKKLVILQDNQSDNATPQELVKSISLHATPYHLKAGDRLQLSISSLTDDKLNFIKKPDYEVKLDEKGQVELPVVGPVSIVDLTLKEAEEKLKKTLSEYLKTPYVSVKLLNFNYTVLGEVTKQGTFNAPDAKVNVLEAIGEAGGLTENANRETVRIIRSESNTTKIYKLNVLEDNVLASDKYFLQPNDVVVIDPLEAKGSRQQQTATLSLIISLITGLTTVLIQLLRNN